MKELKAESQICHQKVNDWQYIGKAQIDNELLVISGEVLGETRDDPIVGIEVGTNGQNWITHSGKLIPRVIKEGKS